MNDASPDSQELLLSGTRLPVTASVVFVEASVERIVENLDRGVRGNFLRSEWGSGYTSTKLPGVPLARALDALLPLTTPMPRRRLLVPTANPRWTAVFDGSPAIADQGGFATWLQVGGLRSLVLVDMPETHNRQTRMGIFAYRAAFWRIPNAENRPLAWSRIVAKNETGRWEYEASPDWPLAAEGDSSASRVQYRLTRDHLRALAAELDLHPYDENFYDSFAGATLITEPGRWEREREWEWAEVRSTIMAEGEPIRDK